jgi:hypothetical protein
MNTNSFVSILLFALSCVGFPAEVFSQQSSLVLSSSSANPVAPGGFLDLTVTPPKGSTLTQVAFISDRQLGIVSVVATPPFHLTAQVPASIGAGTYEVSAIGIGNPGEVFESNTLTFEVERPDAPAQLLLQPDNILFARSATAAPILVMAVFADGTIFDVSHSAAITYQVDDPAIASVDSSGLISAIQSGDTKLTVAYRKATGVIISTAPISVFTQIKVPGLDGIPPSSFVTLLPLPNAAGWNHSNVTVNLTATDNPGGSGVQQITFSATGAQAIASTNTAGSSASALISTEGITSFNFFATDLAGNVESAHIITVKLDTTPPSITGAHTPAPNLNGWNNTDVTVSFACADALSGLAQGSPPTPTVLTSEGANQQVSGSCQDLAGNLASATVSGINIDRTPPVLSGLPVAGCTLWPPDKKFITVATISAADVLSGMSSFNVTGTSNEPMDPNNPDIIISGTGTQPRTVQLRADRLGTGTGRVYTLTTTATDAAGNTTTAVSTCTVPHDQGN